ncbi:MAG: PorV/PorQ family protein [Candidatus Marinimicrobia bacterium]|nr:PorV/PorQ family protein [Candidatus Neomarinimicrobiota bacterium]
MMTNNLPKKRICSQRYLLLITLLLIFTAWLNLSAQTVSKVGTTAAAFLKIGVGGRALGMGEAFTTQANDVSAIFWNPAGLAQINNMQILMNHYDYIADISFDYGACAFSMPGLGTVGAHISFLGMPDIERTTVLEPNGTGEKVSASSMSIGFSYARFLTDRFSIGGTVKYVRESLWHTSAIGYALDVGVLYRAFFKNVMIGMSISNFGTNMQLSGRDLLIQHDIDELSDGNNANINGYLATDVYSMPVLFRVGISTNLTRDILGIQNNDLIFAVDAVHPSDNFEYLNLGAEYRFRDLIALRAGYRQLYLEDTEGGLALGFGIHLGIMNYDFRLDYAAVDFGRLDYLNKFSLILSF